MTIKKHVFAILFSSGALLISQPTYTGQMPGIKPGQTPMELTSDDLAMLQEVEQEINKFVESLPAEEQKKFWQDVDELTKVMSSMSEDELVNFMESAFTNEMPPVPPMTPEEPVEMPTFIPKTEKPAEPVAPVLPPSKQEAAIELIDSIITRINNFLRKAQAIPELTEKVLSWGNKGKLKNWSPSMNWSFLKTKIEDLDQKLNKLKDRDPATGAYRYLDTLIKDEALYNNLSQLRVNVSSNEPRIQVASFGVERLSKSSRQAIVNMINSLNEAFTLLSIPQSIDKIFAQYEPTAKKIKEEEEMTAKRAFEEGKRPRISQPTTVVGRPPEQPRAETGAGDFFGRDFGGRYTPATAPSGPSDKKRDEFEKPKPEAAGKGGEKEQPKKEGEKKKEEEDKRTQDLIKDITNAFDSILEALDGSKELRNLQSYLVTSKSEAGVSGAVGSIIGSLRTATSKANSLKRQFNRLKPEQRGVYKKELTTIFNDYKADLDKLVGQISTIEQRWPVTSSRLAGDDAVRASKRALFGEGDKASGANLLDLREKVQDLKRTISAL